MSATTKTEFISDAFETQVTDDEVESFVSAMEDAVAGFRERIENDETVEELLEHGGHTDDRYTLVGDMTARNQDPEDLTAETLIEPLLYELGYSDLAGEVRGASSGVERKADYSYLIEDERVESRQLLIEAEPVNKKLEGRGHGIDQVEDWLSRREFESDFGFATDGNRWIFVRYDPDSYTHNRIEDIDLGEVFLELFENLTTVQKPAIEALSEGSTETVEDFLRTFERDNFVSIAADARQVIREKQEEITDEFYDAYIRVVFGVRDGNEERSPRSLVGDGVIAPEEATGEDTRLFAVKTMNRLIFVKFLEDKGLVGPDLLNEINETYDEGRYTKSLYTEFIETLFFEVMNKKPEDRSRHVKNVDLFADIPYLNGGLFRPKLGDDELDEREFDIANSVLQEVIFLLERYDFSAEGGPTDLDPSVLGNVFEKTINYLTTDPGDQNKELGAYYTPKEITRFCAEETVRPAVYERIKPIAQRELNWPEETFERYDTVYELIDALPADMNILGPMLDEVDEVRVVDPSMGSGHFLTSVLEEIVSIRKALYAQNDSNPHKHGLKKRTVSENIYGVDIVGPAVEIGKLRLWLSVIAELSEEDAEVFDSSALALPNIAFNLRQGNSLIGYTSFPDKTEDGNSTIQSFNEDTVRSRYKEIINEIHAYEEAGREGLPEKAEEHRQKAFDLLEDGREGLVDDMHQEFVEAGVEGITTDEVEEFDPFHWVLEFAEVYADGGFDVIVGNPPWDVLTPNRDDYFTRYEPRFRTMMPEAKDARQEELMEDEEIAEGYEEYKRNIDIQAQYFNNSPAYELQSPKVAGRTVANENDLSALFFERVFNLAREDGYVAQVLPGAIWNGASCKDLRSHLLDESTLEILSVFENKGIFPEIDNRYTFGVVAFRNSGRTEEIFGKFEQGNVGVLSEIRSGGIRVPRDVLEAYSPESRIFPYMKSQEQIDALYKIVQHPPLGEDVDGAWKAEPYAEIHSSQDRDRYVESEEEGDYPVYGGKNIYQFTYDPTYVEDLSPPELWSVDEDVNPDKSAKRRIREKNLRDLKRAVYDAFDGTGSQVGFVNDLLEEHRGEPLSEDDVLLDCTEYRLTLREIARASDERTSIASVIPRGVVCVHTIHTIRPYEIEPDESDLSNDTLHSAYERVFSDEELFVALGLLNSIPFDYLMRSKVDTHIVMYKFKESQVPRLTEGDDYFEYIWKRAARLNCYGDDFEEMRERLEVEPATEEDERRELQAEIDAAAFHAYGLDREEMEFVLDDFHRVQNPRVMDDDYFEMVKEKYAALGD